LRIEIKILFKDTVTALLGEEQEEKPRERDRSASNASSRTSRKEPEADL
jgi:hypothetical protein